MAKNKIQKQEIFRDIQEKLKKSKSVVFAGFNSLGVKDNDILRASLREEGSEYYVPKKTLLSLALKENDIEIDPKDLEGKVAALFSYEDEVASARVLNNFLKDKEKASKVYFLGGILEGKFIGKDEVIALSKLPGKQDLYANLVGSINAPVSGFVNALAGNLRGLVGVLNAISEKK